MSMTSEPYIIAEIGSNLFKGEPSGSRCPAGLDMGYHQIRQAMVAGADAVKRLLIEGAEYNADEALAAGFVEKIGANVSNVAPGDFVILAWRAPCGTCRSCLRGRPWYCFASQNASQPMTLQDGTLNCA